MPSEQGSVTAFVAVIAVAIMFVAGMVLDGGQLVAAGTDAASLARSAARAGAQEVDVEQLRAHGRPVLEPRAAAEASRRYLAAAGAEGTVQATASTVTVTVTVRHSMRLLPIDDRTITATRTAGPVAGVDGPGDLP